MCGLPSYKLIAEDFAAFTALAPGVLFWLGCRIEGDERELHTPCFDIDEGCLPVGVAVMAETALRVLRKGMPTGSSRSLEFTPIGEKG